MPRRGGNDSDRRGRSPNEVGKGRPRSVLSDYAIREAALDLLSEVGYTGLSMDLLAKQAGVSKATIYRRWRSKEEAIESLLRELVGDVAVPDLGDSRKEIHAAVERAEHFYRRNPAGRAIAALVSDMAAHPRIATVVRSGFVSPWRNALHSMLQRGIARGEFRSDVDPEVASDLLIGSIVYRVLLIGGRVERSYVHGVAEVAYRALARARGRASERRAHRGPRAR